jgi:hypothetical protein
MPATFISDGVSVRCNQRPAVSLEQRLLHAGRLSSAAKKARHLLREGATVNEVKAQCPDLTEVSIVRLYREEAEIHRLGQIRQVLALHPEEWIVSQLKEVAVAA